MVSNSTSVLGALPFDLAAYGVPGCFLRVSPDSSLFLSGTEVTGEGVARLKRALPNVKVQHGEVSDDSRRTSRVG